MKTYRVVAEWGDSWWCLEVPEIPGTFSQVRRLDQVEEMIRDAISLMLETPEDSFGVEVEVVLPGALRTQLRSLGAAQAKAAQLQRQSLERAQALVLTWLAAGWNRRDIASVMGLSPRRASQRAASARVTDSARRE